jgi:hypothetical protein
MGVLPVRVSIATLAIIRASAALETCAGRVSPSGLRDYFQRVQVTHSVIVEARREK